MWHFQAEMLAWGSQIVLSHNVVRRKHKEFMYIIQNLITQNQLKMFEE